MRIKLLKISAMALAAGFVGALGIVLITYPNVPEGSFYNITAWTPLEWVFSIPVATMCLSLVAIITLFLVPIFQKSKEER